MPPFTMPLNVLLLENIHAAAEAQLVDRGYVVRRFDRALKEDELIEQLEGIPTGERLQNGASLVASSFLDFRAPALLNAVVRSLCLIARAIIDARETTKTTTRGQ